MQYVAFSLIIALSRKWVVRAGKGRVGGFLPLLALPVMMKFLGKGIKKSARVDNKKDHMDKNF